MDSSGTTLAECKSARDKRLGKGSFLRRSCAKTKTGVRTIATLPGAWIWTLVHRRCHHHLRLSSLPSTYTRRIRGGRQQLNPWRSPANATQGWRETPNHKPCRQGLADRVQPVMHAPCSACKPQASAGAALYQHREYRQAPSAILCRLGFLCELQLCYLSR